MCVDADPDELDYYYEPNFANYTLPVGMNFVIEKCGDSDLIGTV